LRYHIKKIKPLILELGNISYNSFLGKVFSQKRLFYCVSYKNNLKQVERESKYEIITMGAPGFEPGNLDLTFSFADIYAKWIGI